MTLPVAAAAYSASLSEWVAEPFALSGIGPRCCSEDPLSGAVCSRDRHDETVPHLDGSDPQTTIQWFISPRLLVSRGG